MQTSMQTRAMLNACKKAGAGAGAGAAAAAYVYVCVCVCLKHARKQVLEREQAQLPLLVRVVFVLGACETKPRRK